MKNKEFYKEQMFELFCEGYSIAIDKETHRPCACENINCARCEFCPEPKCTDAFKQWLNQEYGKSVLTDSEKRYLEAVLMPFKNRVLYVAKVISNTGDKAFLEIRIKSLFGENRREGIFLPFFHPKKMYGGMEENRRYTIEELGLFESEENK